MNDEHTRQERREKKRRKKQERMPQHGRNLGRVYRDSVTKRSKQEKHPDEEAENSQET